MQSKLGTPSWPLFLAAAQSRLAASGPARAPGHGRMLGPLPAPQVFRHVMRALALTCCGLASSVHPPQQQAPVPVDEPSSSSSSSSSFAAIGPAVNFSAPSSASLERFITSASKHSRQPLFHQGSLPALTNNGTASRQPWEQHVTPFPAVIFDASWAPPLGPFLPTILRGADQLRLRPRRVEVRELPP